MAQFAVVDRAKAPAPPVKQSGQHRESMRQYETYVLGVKKGRAGRLAPAGPETPKGVALRVRRAARRLGANVEVWVADDVVYFALR